MVKLNIFDDEKNVFFSFLFFFSGIVTVVADNYIPLVKENAVWLYDQRYQVEYPYTPTMKFWFEGDTIIEGESYQCQYMEMTFYFPEYHVTRRYDSAWQEQNKRVYVWDASRNSKVLYYDFNLKKDDAMPDLPSAPVDALKKVTDEDTIEVNGIKRRRLEIVYDYVEQGKHNVVNVYWVEGIGSSMGLYSPVGSFAPGEPNAFGYYEDDNCLFTNVEFFLPKNGKGTATEVSRHFYANDGRTQSSVYYDLQGRLLHGKPVRGLYIKNGKKYVVK